MEAYTSFAEVYDLFMDNVPYEEWSEYLADLLKEYHIEDGLLLDLGCGTGKLTRLMEKKGYDMIGVDYSYDMLAIAKEHSEDSILYLLQDMREFELYGTVRGIYSACDSLNYILEEEELREVFSLVNNYHIECSCVLESCIRLVLVSQANLNLVLLWHRHLFLEV